MKVPWIRIVVARLANLMAIVSSSAAPANAATVSPLPAADVRDAAYGPHERHRLDWWQTKIGNPAPLLVFIHGGGWHGADKSAVPVELLNAMLARSVSVASINYRYTSIATLPGQAEPRGRQSQGGQAVRCSRRKT